MKALLGALLLALVACDASDPRATPLTSGASAVSAPTELVPRRYIWYASSNAGDLGTWWRNPAFDPASAGWPALSPPLGYGESYVYPIDAGTDPAHRPPTAYFLTSFEVADPHAVSHLFLDVMYDDGFVAYLNGHEIGRVGLSGTVTYGTLAAGHEANDTYQSFDVDAAARAWLTPGTNVLAVEVHQVSASSSDLVFDASLRAQVERSAPDPIPDWAQGVSYEYDSWLYWDRGTDPGPAWRDGSYDDSAWKLAPAPLGYGESYIVGPVDPGPSASAKPITVYFRRQFIEDTPERVTSILGELRCDDGAVVYLNGHEIQRASMPAGPIGPGTLAYGHEAPDFFDLYDWGAYKSYLVEGVNTVAVEVHQASASSSDLVFDLQLRIGRTWPREALTPLDPGTTWKFRDDGVDLGSAWRALDYDDAAWSSGPAPLGFGSPRAVTAVRPGPVTTYFRRSFDWSMPAGFAVSDILGGLDFDDGAVVYLNGHEVGRTYSMPSGTITAATTASWPHGASGLEQYRWDYAAAWLRPGRNVVAVEVHQAAGPADDLLFDLSLDVNDAPRFVRHGSAPVLAPSHDAGGERSWYARGVRAPSVLRAPAGGWLLYFEGFGAGVGGNIGRATSPDGLAWTVDESPVSWGNFPGSRESPSVVWDGSRYQMWYSHRSAELVEHATSPDGVAWTDDPANPTFTGAYDPWVILDGGVFRRFVQSGGYTYAGTSSDGFTWQRHPGPVNNVYSDRVAVVRGDDGLEMYYPAYDGIRYATSPDGFTWTHRGLALANGPDGAWDRYLLAAAVVRDGATRRLWYVGYDGSEAQAIGYAEAP